MGIYKDLGRNPGVFRVLVSQLLARFPFGMLSIILLLHMQNAYGNYSAAGMILAAASCGQAIAGPLTSRLMGTLGTRRVLAITSAACSTLLAVIALTHLPLLATMGIAVIIGFSTPPIFAAVRSIYPRIVPGNQISALFSLDAAAQELIWVLGPVMAVFITAKFGTVTGLLTAAIIMLGGGAWFIASPALSTIRIPKSRKSLGAVLRRPTVLLTVVISFFFVASFAAIEAAIVSAFAPVDSGSAQSNLQSGVVLAVFATGSLVGGLLAGQQAVRPWSLAIRIAVVLVGTAACLITLNIWWLMLVLFIGGLGTAPTFAAISSIISATVKFSETAEAHGWIGTGQLVGIAIGSALAGVAIDASGARGAVLVSASCLVLALASAGLAAKWAPDLKGRTLEPPPETDTISLRIP